MSTTAVRCSHGVDQQTTWQGGAVGEPFAARGVGWGAAVLHVLGGDRSLMTSSVAATEGRTARQTGVTRSHARCPTHDRESYGMAAWNGVSLLHEEWH